MSTATETQGLGLKDAPAGAAAAPIVVTERAAAEVRRHVDDYLKSGAVEPGAKLYLRVRTLGGGCSGLQDKLDLDPQYNEKSDNKYEFHGIEVVIDRRSVLYLTGSTIDFHDGLNKSGFTITNPNRKGTCGCGSSYSV